MNNLFKLTVLALLATMGTNSISLAGDFELIKERVTSALLRAEVNDPEVERLIETLKDDGTWPGIDYTDVSNEGFQHSRHTGNLVAMARAYSSKPSAHHRSKKLRQAVVRALTHWVEHDYICENWWHNQIGTPDNLGDMMLLMGNDLPPELVAATQPIIGRANTDAPGARPGGDRIKIAGIQAKNMLFTGNRQAFDSIVRIIENEIHYVEWPGRRYGYTWFYLDGGFNNRTPGGRGIQYGNSFHHRADGVNNTLSYGIGYAEAFAEWAVYTAGTAYAFDPVRLERLIDYYLDGICRMSVYGRFPDPGAKNRSVSRPGALRPYSAATAEQLLLTTGYRRAELQEIAAIRNNGSRPTLSHATFFWNSEHFSFQRPTWFASVRMYSTRTHNMEEPYNSEGLLNHHRGDGASHLSRTGDEYYDIFPVFDYQKVPGATIMQKEELPPPAEIQKIGAGDFAGAVTDGLYGAVGFDFRSPHDPLVARKAWFFFDNQYLCLGSGISCREQRPVVTTLNQCLLRGEVTVAAGNDILTAAPGEKEYTNVSWVFHDSTGYIFPEPVDAGLKNNTATGSWWDISKQTSTSRERVEKEVFSLWLSHGNRPSDATYQYIVAPSVSVGDLKQLAAENPVRILSNTPEVQAAYHAGLGICQAVFYRGGEVQVTENLKIVSDNPGIVMVKIRDGRVTGLTVADPNRELRSYNLSLSARIPAAGENFTAHRDEAKNLTHVTIGLPHDNYAGSSVTVKF